MKLMTKFNLVIVSVLLAGLVTTDFTAWHILAKNAEREVRQTAGLMMEAARAMRGYTINEIRPLLAPHMTETFFPQTVPAYAATQAFNEMRTSHPEFLYKEAALNPTNPRDRATDWEADLIQLFRSDVSRTEATGVRNSATGTALYLARPIRITNKDCLTCHSVPKVAPASVVALYGDDNGFGWKLDEVIGAQVVSVPMSLPLENARNVFMIFMSAFSAVFVISVLVLNVMLKRIVINPIVEMAALADEVSRGDLQTQFPSNGKDEFATLAAAFNRMRRSLKKALGMLGQP